jgi:hypothetical protein
MELVQSFDFLTGVNPTIKIFVYILIVIHLAAVGIWCAFACPGMFKRTESFSDRVEKVLKEKSN